MATSTTVDPGPDLLSIGKHCSVPACRQLDFLPFQCQHCQHVYCLEHRQPAQHSCSATSAADTTTVLCPMCAKAIRLRQGEDPNAAWERHSRQGACDPANYAAVHAKPRCPVPNCREKLAASNKYTCRDCGRDVCLKHRFPASHACTPIERPRPSAASRLLTAWAPQSQQTTGKSIGNNNNKAWWAKFMGK